MFKKLEGHNVLFSSRVISAEQHKLLQEIIAYYSGETKLTRKQLRDAHGALRGKKAAPYFVSKNVVCKIKGQHGMYDVSRLKVSADSAKKAAAVESNDTVPETPKPKAKREAKPRREAKAKKEVSAASETGDTKQIEAPSEAASA